MSKRTEQDEQLIKDAVVRLTDVHHYGKDHLPELYLQGLGWYIDMQHQCRDIAREVLSLKHQAFAYDESDVAALTVGVAGVVAALSPQTPLRENIANARAVMLAAALEPGHDLSHCPAVQTLGQRAKAWMIATGELTPLEALNGPKETAFYLNIIGVLKPVTVDRWAARAAFPDEFPPESSFAVSARWFRLCTEAYTRAADQVGLEPAVLQSVIWTLARGRAD